MMRFTSAFMFALLVAGPTVLSQVQTPAQMAQPEFVNEHVRIRRVFHAPHRSVALHEVPPSLIVYVTAAHERITYGDGNAKEMRFKPGEYEWWPGGRLGAENLDETPTELLVIVPVGK